ncbi:hypothethical protein (plasmid) [Ralstonia solanacearum PSI07]|nr:hypothethical protein [Ralstonia solanacearum PSI07]
MPPCAAGASACVNKRLGHVLTIAVQVQAQRDSLQQAGPSRTLAGEPPRPAWPLLPPSLVRLDRFQLEFERVPRPLCLACHCSSHCLSGSALWSAPRPEIAYFNQFN